MGGKERGALTEPMFYVLMSFLRRDMCGIDITEFVECKTNGRVRLGPGTLYTLLAKFQDEEWIEETQVDGRKRTYRITDRGRAVFREELERLRACAADGEEEYIDGDELLGQFGRARLAQIAHMTHGHAV